MIRPITDTLRVIEGGAFHDTASVELNKLVRHLDENGGAGSVTITIAVKKAAGGVMALAGTVTTKMPKVKPEETLMWPTAEGNLVQDNPKQQKLELRQVEETPVRERELRTAT